MNRLTTLIPFVLVAVATLLSVTCSHAIDAPANAGASKRLKAIIEDNYHPYSFINEQGQADGFSVEITRAVARTMNLEIEIRAGKFDVAINDLETGQIDLIPVMAPSPEREKIFNFSVPYTVVYDAIFFRKGTTGISSLKDLSGKTVIVTNKDLAHHYLLTSGLSKDMNIVLVNSGPDALKQLAAGKGDAAIMPKLIGLVTVKKLNLVDIETSPLLVESYTRLWGFAVKAGNLALLERLNQGLNIIKSTGEFDAIYKKWFGALEGTNFNLKRLLTYGSGALLIFLSIITWNVMLKRQVKAKTENLVAQINQRKQAEELLRESAAALQASELKYRMLFEQAADAILISGPDACFREANDRACLLFGYSAAEFCGLAASAVVESDEAQQQQEVFRRIAAGERVSSERQFRRKDGSVFAGELTACQIKEGLILCLVRDNTERKQNEVAQIQSRRAALNMMTDAIESRERAEQMSQEVIRINAVLEQRVVERTAQLEAVNKELETFSYSVSHDLKAPLRGIDGYSQLLERECSDRLDDEGRLFIQNIRHGAAQMHELIEDMLAYSRMERRTLQCIPLDLAALVQVVVAERAAVIEQSGTQMHVNVPAICVRADRDGLAVALRNLLENATKFSRNAQPPTVEIGARIEGDRAILWVSDNGIGFDMKFHDRIFEIFQRLERAEDYPGTGIGLAMVRKAVGRMGGKVWAESTPGGGATFYLEVPQ